MYSCKLKVNLSVKVRYYLEQMGKIAALSFALYSSRIHHPIRETAHGNAIRSVGCAVE